MSGKLFLSIMISVALVVPASADITTVTDDVVHEMTIPSSLDLDQYESNDYIRLLDEQQGVTLGSDLFVDIAASGTYNQAGDLTGAGGTIAAGTQVNSYVIHVDPVGSATSPLYAYSGSITFSNPILGVIVETSSLNASDDAVGLIGMTYYEGANRGLEWTNQDEVILSLSTNTLTLSLKAANVLDNVRVIEAVPVPAAVLLGMLGLGAAGLKLRKYV